MIPKFRAWNKTNKEMFEWKELDFTKERGEDEITIFEPTGQFAHPIFFYDAMQSTGLKDKNGVEIYEGDILKILVMSVSDKYVYGEVVYEYGVSGLKNVLNGWGYEQGLIPLLEVGHVYEVVGNIYENPELLEGD